MDQASDADGQARSGESEEAPVVEIEPAQGAPSGDAPVQELRNKILRLQADFDNYRRRTARTRADAAADTRREMLAALLPVYDNFMHALLHAEEAPELMPFLSGFEMIRQQLEQFFVQQGFEPIAANPGDEFDPNVHEAAGTLRDESGALPAGSIARELQRGYLYKGILVRPARVFVVE
jgi:molecular chaperone GrpE